MNPLITCALAGLQYLLHPQKLGTIQETINPDALIPVTLLTTHQIFGNVDRLLHLYDLYDDVFIPDFGNVLVEKTPDNGTEATSASQLRELGLNQTLYHMESSLSPFDFQDLPSGPYFLYGPNLYQAWRLYPDDYGAFAFGVIPEDVNEPTSFRSIDTSDLSGLHSAIPVPSKLYHPTRSGKKPLTGKRVSVSDNMSLKGVRTTMSSRSWASLYNSSAESTAPYLQKLIELGAIIVGKTRSAQFSVGQEWIDVNQPFNPRGDEYQNPAGGSTGAAVAMAGYEWLSRAIGEDGVREPATAVGVYSFRPSHGRVDLDGIQVSSQTFESPGLTSRLMYDLLRTVQVTLGLERPGPGSTKHLLYPIDFDSQLSAGEKMLLEKLMTVIENGLGLKVERLSLENRWSTSPPSEAGKQGLQQYMQDVYFSVLCYEFSRGYKGFQQEYNETFGRRPFVEATPAFMWETGMNVDRETYENYIHRIQVFQDWFDQHVLSNDSHAAMILPNLGGSHGRDELESMTNISMGIQPHILSPILGAPQMVVPFAQTPYESEVSGRKEYRPVSASILGSRDKDMMVIELAKHAFEAMRWRTRIDVGRFTFPPADNPRNVDDRQVPVSEVVPRSEVADDDNMFRVMAEPDSARS